MSDKYQKIGKWLEGKPKPVKYDFTPDPKEVCEEKGDVSFLIVLKGPLEDCTINPNDVKATLEGMTTNIGYVNYLRNTHVMGCRTDQKTYEKLFNTILEFDSNKQGFHGYTPEGYKEVKPATIPQQLEDMIHSVHLNSLSKI